jgi:hypothetical protein
MVLTISEHAPMCTRPAPACVETTSATRAYPVSDGDNITIDWTGQPALLDGTIEVGHLYLPLGIASSAPVTPVTLVLELRSASSASAVVVYGGTSHHVPLQLHTWQRVTIYNPDERSLYLRLDPPDSHASAVPASN